MRWRVLTFNVLFLTGSSPTLPLRNASQVSAIRRRAGGDIWQGLWEPFNASIHEDSAPATIIEIQSLLQLPSASLLLLTKGVKHVLTHRILLADFYLLDTESRPLLPEDYIWVREDDIYQYGIPRLVEILLEKVSDL